MKGTSFRVGLFLGVIWILAAVLAPLLAPETLGTFRLSEQLFSPSSAHWLGLNHHGQDLLTVVLYGARVSLVVGLAVVSISAVLGVALGLTSGYFGGRWDRVISRVIEIVLAFPGILLAIAMAAVLGPSIGNVVIALAVSGWIPFARLVRGQTLTVRERDFVKSARVLGVSSPRILLRHILPILWGPILVQSTFSLSAAILAESSLSFLGLGVPLGTPSWGKAVADGARYLLSAPHLATFPGIAIMLAVLAFNFVGDGLRDHFSGR